VVPAGYLGYKVYRSWFGKQVSTQPATAKPLTGSFLFLDLSVVNTDKKDRSVGPLKLLDEQGKAWVLSEKGDLVEQSIAKVGKLAPSVSKRAVAVFEVPVGHQYQLKLAGFSDADSVLIELSPTAPPP